MTNYHSTKAVAAYLGTRQNYVSIWAKNGQDEFPNPASAHCDWSGKITGRGWSDEQLPALRSWMERRLNLSSDEAVTHWEKVDKINEQRGLVRALPGKHSVNAGQEAFDLGEL